MSEYGDARCPTCDAHCITREGNYLCPYHEREGEPHGECDSCFKDYDGNFKYSELRVSLTKLQETVQYAIKMSKQGGEGTFIAEEALAKALAESKEKP